MFYTITITTLQGKPLKKYAFANKQEAEKYYSLIIKEKKYQHVNLILQDSRNDILKTVFIKTASDAITPATENTYKGHSS